MSHPTNLSGRSALVPIGSARPNQIRNELFDSIHTLDQTRSLFCACPDKHFTRNCSLSFSKLIQIILGFGTSTVFGELSEQLCGDRRLPAKNAFVIGRQKILPEAFSSRFRDFMSHFTSFNTLKGFRVLAADCTDLCIPRNLNDYNTMVKGKPGSRPYHQLCIEALYDIINNTYTDFIVDDFNDHSEQASFLSLVHRLKDHRLVTQPAKHFNSRSV